MWIVRLALNRPYTFIVVALLIVILGFAMIQQTPTDIFPNIDIPVISVIWNYRGLSTKDMESQMTIFSEYSISSVVSDIKNIESQTLSGVAVIKIYFHPSVKIDAATAQVTAVSQTILRRMPPGTQPPFIIRYNASNVPILQLSLSSKTLSEAQLYDYGIYKIRQQIAIVQGTSLPLPYGGKPRQIMVDLDTEALLANGLSAQDVNAAVTAQNFTLPTGTAKIGAQDYSIALNSSPDAVQALNDVPVKVVKGKTIYLRDVAQVHDGFQVQTNVVRQEGRRSVLLTVLKSGSASTLDIAERVKALLPSMRAAAPPGLEITLLSDQSLFVSTAIHGVLTEGLIAACLTAMMILLFLGSWRSTLIVSISIPLSILVSIILLNFLGQTMNVMTLGGLALAVGILVDDATVEIENIHRNIAMGKKLRQAILDGAQQIAVPAFVSTLAICIVFLPVVFLTGPAQFLFTPLALAVVFAMLASYLLSRTVIPTLVKFLLKAEVEAHGKAPSMGFFSRIQRGFEQGFEGVRRQYLAGLEWALGHRRAVFAVFGLALLSAGLLLPWVGRDFFPSVDTGQLRLHVKAPAGTRIEDTEQIFTKVENAIRSIIPDEDRALILDNFGLPDGINLAFGDSATLGSSDGEILISLAPKRRGSTEAYVKQLREKLPEEFPNLSFYFQPADIVSQILNFGLPAPIDIQVSGFNRDATFKIARQIEKRVTSVPGAVDVHLHQVIDAPQLRLRVDRVRAAEAGLSQRDVANNVLVSLASSGVVSPNYWTDPQSGINYPLAIQTPQHQVDSLEAIGNMTMGSRSDRAAQLLSDLATIERETTPLVANHSNVQPTFNVRADVQDTDLGSVSKEVDRILRELRAKAPPGVTITVRGQVDSMNSAFSRLGLGLVAAALLVYFLMVVNFQSWVDPFIIITALPGAIVGIVWMLFVTQTTFNVPSLMGAVMSIGVATANSILMVTFANQRRQEGADALTAALDAGRTRLRPVLMTALAMMIGMMPMSLGWGEGGEQNAPLGRAVLGGLLVATFATLFFVPVVYTLLRKKAPVAVAEEQDTEKLEAVALSH
jgi:multidrug efflux pump subunit AcrB